MKVLPLLCKDAKEHVCRVADILAQLLQLEDQDYNTACSSLIQVFKEDELSTTKAIFNHIHTTDENASREKSIQFLYKKLNKITEKLSAEIEELLLEEGKKIIQVGIFFCRTLEIIYLLSSNI